MPRCSSFPHSRFLSVIGILTNVSSYYEWWLFEGFRISARGLALFRMAFAGFLLVLALPSYRWISTYPDALFAPPVSIAALLDGFPPPLFFEGLSLALALGVVLLFFGWWTRTTSVLLTLVALVGQSFAYSFGKIDHDVTLFWMVPLVMAFSGWGRALSIDARRREEKGGTAEYETAGWPVAVMATIVAVGFLSAGLPKFFGWIDFDLATQGVRDWAFGGYYEKGRQDYLLPFLVRLENPLFWEVLDITAVVFELAFFVSLAVPRAFKAFCCVAVLFHVANYFMLNIAFVMLFPVYMLFLPWTQFAEQLQHGRGGYLAKLDAAMRSRVVAGTIAVYLPLAAWAGYLAAAATPAPPLSLLFYPLPMEYRTAFDIVVFAVGLCTVVCAGMSVFRQIFGWRFLPLHRKRRTR